MTQTRQDERTLALHDKYKWDVNKILDTDSNTIPEDNGYFGTFTKVTYKGKQAIVYVDGRDALVKVRTGWYDAIYYGCEYGVWDADNRWNFDMPLIVKNDGKYNIIGKNGEELIEHWLPSILLSKWKNRKPFGYYLIGKDEYEQEVYITPNGSLRYAETCSPIAIEKRLEQVKAYSAEEAETLWIDKGLPCAHIHGLELKGARWRLITQAQAKEFIKTHRRFTGMFNDAEWRFLDGRVTLLFRDYANSDYD